MRLAYLGSHDCNPNQVAKFCTARNFGETAILLQQFDLGSLGWTMKREYPDSPLVGVGAVIVEKGRVVLVKRGHPPLQGEWSIPGGMLEVGETLREAAVREAREETGLIIAVDDLLGVYDRVLPDDAGRTLYHYVLIDFLCRRADGELQAAGDADEARWFTPGEAAKLALAKDTADVIRKGFEKASISRHK